MNISYEEAVKRGWLTAADVPRQARPTKARKNEIEGDEQIELITTVRSLFPDIGDLLIHIPNGGSRKNAFEGWRLKAQGVRAGVSDLFLPVARGGFFGLWLEFKAEPPYDAPISDSQQEWLRLMLGQGYQAALGRGVAEALSIIQAYLRLSPTCTTQKAEASLPL